MKILWHSNAPYANTGYGNQTALFANRLADSGHEMLVSCFYGLNGTSLNLGKLRLLPGSKDAYGNDMLFAHKEYYGIDLTLILCDAWVYNPSMLRSLGNAYIWAPVDHDPVPPAVVNSVEAARGVIAMSKFGKRQFEAAGLTAYYVPHGVDSKVFTKQEQSVARKALDIADGKFMAGMVLANKGAPSRKAFDQQIRAFAAFHKRHPDSLLYLHTDMIGHNGENIDRIIELAGLPRSAVITVSGYKYLNGMFGDDYMNTIYNALDVVMNATRGEGFGIPIMEAQMCGTPVIVTDATAMSELAHPEQSWKVPYVDKVFTAQDSYQFIPSVKAIEDALEAAYQRKKANTVDRDAIRQWAMAYDADTVFEKYMLPTIAAIQQELKKDKARNTIIEIGTADKPKAEPVPVIIPDVSVVMPAYNAKETIDRAIKSVIEDQGDLNLELIIVDDSSTDGTWKHLRNWRDRTNIITVKNLPGGGPVGALNKSIEHIKGRYVIKLDADDWFEPNGLRVLMDLLEKNPDVGFVYGACQYHGKLNLINTPLPFDANLFWDSNRAIGEPMYRASAHKEHGLKHRGFWERDGRTFGPHDWDLILQMIVDLKWRGMTTTELIHHYHFTDNSASNETKARNGTVMAAFRKQWPMVRAEAL